MFEMMEFREIDRLRGNPSSLKTSSCGCCSGGVHFKPSYSTMGNQDSKYSVGKSKNAYGLDKSYFEAPTKTSSYSLSSYKMFSYQAMPINNRMAAKIKRIDSISKQKTNDSFELENLEALIQAAKEKEIERWTQ